MYSLPLNFWKIIHKYITPLPEFSVAHKALILFLSFRLFRVNEEKTVASDWQLLFHPYVDAYFPPLHLLIHFGTAYSQGNSISMLEKNWPKKPPPSQISSEIQASFESHVCAAATTLLSLSIFPRVLYICLCTASKRGRGESKYSRIRLYASKLNTRARNAIGIIWRRRCSRLYTRGRKECRADGACRPHRDG